MPPRIDFRPYRRPFKQPLRTARGEWSVREGFIVRCEGPHGPGFGEVAPIPEFGSETVEQAGDFLYRFVKDPELTVPMELPCCAFALSAAIACPAANSEPYPLSGLLPAGAGAVESLRAKLDAGFRNFKWKVGVESVEAEQTIFATLSESLPQGVRLRLDANGSWDLDSLQRWVEFLLKYRQHLDYIEQPLAVGHEEAMSSIANESGLPIALDESLQGDAGRRLLEAGAWNGPLVIKPALMGDRSSLSELLRPVADQVVLSSVFETAVGVANTLSLAQDLSGLSRPLGFDTAATFNDSLSLPSESASLSLSAYNADLLWETLPPLSK